MKKTAIPGFYKKTPDERLDIISNIANLNKTERDALRAELNVDVADGLIENTIGTFTLPLGIATNFRINNRDYIIPMVIEEPSVVAAASAGAKATDNVTVTGGNSHVIGQIQVLNPDADATAKVLSRKSDILDATTSILSGHMSVVGVYSSMLDVQSRMLKVEIVIDTGEAMGANAVNTICEGLAPIIEEITGGRVLLRILSNAVPGVVSAQAHFKTSDSVARDIVSAYEFAHIDKLRAVTHNKGIMNGITAVAMATGQDTRAIEAAAHMYAAESGVYGPLSKWYMQDDRLCGELHLPIRVGTVGGLTTHHDTAATCLKILGNPTSQELAGIMVSVGLCQNFSALRTLSTDGIQKGHMKLHARRL